MPYPIGRREAVKALTGMTLWALGLESILAGCGSSNTSNANPGATPPGATSACTTTGTATTVEGDPLHQLVVPREDVSAAVEKSYHIQGRENHDHIVTLTPADFQSLQRDAAIRVQSGPSMGPVATHFHFVDVSCASA